MLGEQVAEVLLLMLVISISKQETLVEVLSGQELQQIQLLPMLKLEILRLMLLKI